MKQQKTLRGIEPLEVKTSMLDEITKNFTWYSSHGRVVLNFMNRDLTAWLEYHSKSNNVRADEICLYTLNHMYDRHTLILNRNWPWCTIRFTGDPSKTDFANSCDLHLLNIGPQYVCSSKTARGQCTKLH